MIPFAKIGFHLYFKMKYITIVFDKLKGIIVAFNGIADNSFHPQKNKTKLFCLALFCFCSF